MSIRPIFWLLLLPISLVGFNITTGHSQPSSLVSPTPKYPFIRHDLNFIDNSLRGLNHFYKQLNQLKSGERRTVNIVHIGDSHIQADWFSGKLRTELQQRFGSAGRGLVFPYDVARTNGPQDISSSSNVKWKAKRNVFTENPLPIGVSGITLQTRASNFSLSLSVKENPALIDYHFNKVTLFTDRGPSNFDLLVSNGTLDHSISSYTNSSGASEEAIYHKIESGETLGSIARKYKVSLQQLRDLNGIENNMIYAGRKLLIRNTKVLNTRTLLPRSAPSDSPMPVSISSPTAGGIFTSTIYLDQPSSKLVMSGAKQSAAQQKVNLYGIMLENYQQSGILYHMIGVNGAKFEHFNKSIYFLDQLQALEPDLIIISLGTNETISYGFNSELFYTEVDAFIHSLEQNLPYADILVTTPPDALQARKHENNRIFKAKNLLLSYVLNHDLGGWDFYEVMGGKGSMQNWYDYGLAQQDRLHLTRAGYELQGKLLFEAIIKGYDEYPSN